MTPERAKQERERADKLLYAYEALAKAKQELDLVNAYVKSGQVWKPDLCIKKGNGWGERSISITVTVPAEIIQQQAVDAWKRARRQVVLLGGELP